MAILAIRIEDAASILLNEFFDYGGQCWAISRDRKKNTEECMPLEDFYECTIRTEWLDDVPVVFVCDDHIIGWYTSARIYRKLKVLSPFMEGNIVADVRQAKLLASGQKTDSIQLEFEDQYYKVIDEYDVLHVKLSEMMKDPGLKTIEIRFDLLPSGYDGKKVRMAAGIGKRQSDAAFKMADYCLDQCNEIAYKAMNDQCRDIRDFKTMYDYASEVTKMLSKNTDGWYYLAMACEQTGRVKEGIKAIEKALALEPDGDDLIALKGHLLFAMERYEQAITCYQEAHDISPEDGYLLCIGQTYLVMGKVDMAYKAYKRISDPEVLKEKGIDLKDIEHRWPFVAIRNFFGKKNK